MRPVYAASILAKFLTWIDILSFNRIWWRRTVKFTINTICVKAHELSLVASVPKAKTQSPSSGVHEIEPDEKYISQVLIEWPYWEADKNWHQSQGKTHWWSTAPPHRSHPQLKNWPDYLLTLTSIWVIVQRPSNNSPFLDLVLYVVIHKYVLYTPFCTEKCINENDSICGIMKSEG